MVKSLKVSEIYASQLVHLLYGHPLWYPEPEESGEVDIGDVGNIDGGKFVRLFNACCAEDDAVNTRHGVPAGFVRLQLPDGQRRKQDGIVKPGDALRSDSVHKVEIQTAAEVSTCVYVTGPQ